MSSRFCQDCCKLSMQLEDTEAEFRRITGICSEVIDERDEFKNLVRELLEDIRLWRVISSEGECEETELESRAKQILNEV